ARRTTASAASSARRPAATCGSPAQRIARAADRLDESRSAARLELDAQVFDAHVHEVRIAQIVETPDVLKNLLTRQHLARMPQEQLEQLVLAGGQLQLLAVAAGFAFAGHHLDVVKAQHFEPTRLHAPKQGAHAGHQLVGIEGLDHVVVGPTVEAADFVDGLVTCRKHQDGDHALAPNRAADLEPVEAGHHDVKDDQVDLPAANDVQRRLA